MARTRSAMGSQLWWAEVYSRDSNGRPIPPRRNWVHMYMKPRMADFWAMVAASEPHVRFQIEIDTASDSRDTRPIGAAATAALQGLG
jgi:hypothetical protein